ncbi:MAG: AsmA-like C-terminal region-containing protein [Isosphaeraceae bacterium]
MVRRIRTIFGWLAMFALATVVGGLVYAYYYVTDSATLAAMIRREVPRFLPEVQVEVIRALVRPLAGECELRRLTVWQVVDGIPRPLLQTPYLRIRQDVNALLEGKFAPKEVDVAQPTLRLFRRPDGSWNLQNFLADPWPAPPLENFPLVRIENGTLELDHGDDRPVSVLTQVSARLEADPGSKLVRIHGTARGQGLFDTARIEGTCDLKTGRIELAQCEVLRLSISELLGRLPADYRDRARRSYLVAGDVTIRRAKLDLDPLTGRLGAYSVAFSLRNGATVDAPDLPFALGKVEADGTLADGLATIEYARASSGKTVVHAEGTLGVSVERDPIDLTISVEELELDDRLRAWTPPDLAKIWDEYSPSGRVDVVTRVAREVPGGPVAVTNDVACRDVAGKYHLFPYPLEHLTGTLTIACDRIDVNMGTRIGNQPAWCRGTILRPGPDPHVVLDFQADGLPISEELLGAMPGEIRKVVDQFRPTGTVKGKARVERVPTSAEKPNGDLILTTDLALEESGRCSVTWEGLPYPITNLTGRLRTGPDHWIFEDIRGRNGVTTITGSGRVDKLAGGLKVDLKLEAQELQFDQQLYQALPEQWRTSWDALNPSGSSHVKARIRVNPGEDDHQHLEINPGPDTRIRLKFKPVRAGGVAGPDLEMPPMEKVSGSFIFDDGTVSMNNVQFWFRGSPVRFDTGTVQVADGGRFKLGVLNLYVRDFRLDSGLRQIMPPVMAGFAQRVDRGGAFTMRADLGLGWSGQAGEPAWCEWEKGKVIFTGNAIDAGLPLTYIQGQVDNLKGRFDGQDLNVEGHVDLASVNVMGQQVTNLTGNLAVGQGRAQLSDIRGALLGGSLDGWVVVDLEATPRYAAALQVNGLDLREYNRTVPGKQNVRGLLNGQIALQGIGDDRKTLQGRGEAHLIKADLGELPAPLRPFRYLQLSAPWRMPAPSRTAFDSGDVAFHVQDGRAIVDTMQLIGDAFSLDGRGTVDLTDSDMDLRLRVLYGRDRLRLGRFSDLMREASGGIFDVRVTGTPASPRITPEALPVAGDLFRRTFAPGRLREE